MQFSEVISALFPMKLHYKDCQWTLDNIGSGHDLPSSNKPSPGPVYTIPRSSLYGHPPCCPRFTETRPCVNTGTSSLHVGCTSTLLFWRKRSQVFDERWILQLKVCNSSNWCSIYSMQCLYWLSTLSPIQNEWLASWPHKLSSNIFMLLLLCRLASDLIVQQRKIFWFVTSYLFTLCCRMSRHCFVVGCHNGDYGLLRWKGKKCPRHEVFQGDNPCDCLPPFRCVLVHYQCLWYGLID